MEENSEQIESQGKFDVLKKYLPKSKKTIFLAIFFIVVVFFLFLFTSPFNFPKSTVFNIESGEHLNKITQSLETNGFIRSSFIFRSLVIVLGGEKKIIAGSYLFDKSENPFNIALRFIKGDFGMEDKKITIPEGWNRFQIAEYLKKNLVNFDDVSFLELTKMEEGYLFPDTYFVPAVSTPKSVIEIMNSNFEEKIKNISGLSTSTRSLKEIITMASILEGEAKTIESRKIVSGILWKRIAISMPLQVDATFQYINGKNTYELSLDDLKIDSPYNTYKYKGLPPTPINNPGLDSILAALYPTKTNYLYFLSNKNGDMYYSKDFEGHQLNREKYLNK